MIWDDEDRRALALTQAEDDHQAMLDRSDRLAEREALSPWLFDEPQVGLAYRERVRPARTNRRTAEDILIGGLLTFAMLVCLLVALSLIAIAVAVLP